MLLALSVISHQSQRLGASSYRIFDEQGGSIGRGLNNEWVLDDPTCQLSSRHLAVSIGERGFVVEDKSSNGTGLNDRDTLLPRGQRVPIADGDRLFLGDFEILVQVVEHGAPAGTARKTAPTDETVFGAAALTPTATGDMAVLYAALGLPPQAADAVSIAQVADVLKVVTQGVIDLLDARRQIMDRYRLPRDRLESDEDNPLLLRRSAEAVLHDLFGKAELNSAELTLTDAFKQAFDILIRHQAGILAGLQAAPLPRQCSDAFVRGYDDHVRQLNDATIFDDT